MTVKRHTLMAHQSFPDLPAEVVAASDYDALAADFLALKEYCAALESREVCTVAHEDVETCGYCQRDALRKDADRYRWLRENVGYVIDGGDYAVRGLAMDLAIDAEMEGR